jgi:hypothetical protein
VNRIETSASPSPITTNPNTIDEPDPIQQSGSDPLARLLEAVVRRASGPTRQWLLRLLQDGETADSASSAPARPDLNTTPELLDEIEAGEGEPISRLVSAVPSTRAGGKSGNPRPETIWRWATSGVLGPGGARIKLEAARLAGRLLSTRAALRRFLRAQQTEQQNGEPMPQNFAALAGVSSPHTERAPV